MTPYDTVLRFAEAMRRDDVGAALALYEPEAAFVAEPGRVVRGREALRAALTGFFATKPDLSVESYTVVEAGDVALYCSRWRLRLATGDGQIAEMSGRAANVLRRQPDGSWLFCVDNPWGTDVA